jgi:hypothetical protein
LAERRIRIAQVTSSILVGGSTWEGKRMGTLALLAHHGAQQAQWGGGAPAGMAVVGALIALALLKKKK